MLGDEQFTKAKNRTKVIRTIFETICVILALIGLYFLFFHVKTYRPYAASEISDTQDTGFIALSYFGVDRIGDTSELIGEKQLFEHLSALKDQGYVTITTQDIIDYYQNGKKLPPKSVYLMFEDGRRDTAVFADDQLEKLNYKGVMMTYAKNFEDDNPKFLRPTELKDMESSTFWELGTNGYRLEYINVFDRYHNYIGEIDPLKYAMIHSYLGREYNHYLMDFIRDKHYIPKETMPHMQRRIAYDYEKVRDVYTEKIGYVPPVYVLMHSNTSAFGNEPHVSQENAKWIRKLFAINFNREGYCFNKNDSSIYDLTRMQPQSYWPVNHLLMRIKYDTNHEINFEQGNAKRMTEWQMIMGAGEFKGESVIVTSIPMSMGIAKLRNIVGYEDMRVQVRLEGNSYGDQFILLRSNEDRTKYIAVGTSHGDLVIKENNGSGDHILYKEKISILEGHPQISVEEDKKNAEVREYETFARYADSKEMAEEYLGRMQKRKDEPARTVDEGAEPYIGPESVKTRLDKQLDLSLKGNDLTLKLDGETVASVHVNNHDSGSVFLTAGWDADAWSQRNLADDVYDGVFEKLIIKTNTHDDEKDDKVLYSTELTGWDGVKFKVNQKWEAVLGWFLKTF